MTGVEMIAAERRRQVEAEGWTPEHDDEHDSAELAMAAFAYTLAAIDAHNGVCWEDEDGAPLPPPERLWPAAWWRTSYLVVDGEEMTEFDLLRLPYVPKSIVRKMPHDLRCPSESHRMELMTQGHPAGRQA